MVPPDSHTATLNGRVFDQPRAEAAVRELLYAIGEDPDRHGLLDTPARVARELPGDVRRPLHRSGYRAEHHL